MTALWYAIFLVLFAAAPAGCAPAPKDARSVESEDVNAAIYAWRAHGLPYDASCDPPLVRVLEAPAFESVCMRVMCGSTPAERPKGCTEACYANGVVIVGTPYDAPGHRRHELMHWIQECQGLVQDHEDPRIWDKISGALAEIGG